MNFETGTLLLVTLSWRSMYQGVFLPRHGTGGLWHVEAPLSHRRPIQVRIPHQEVLGNVTYAWFGWIPGGGGE